MPTKKIENNFKGSGALDAFLNLLSLITLGWSVLAIGGTAFQIIDRFFASEAINLFYFSQSRLKFNVASILIVVPVFLLAINILHRHYRNKKLNFASGISRWLTYLMLLVSSLAIVGSLISLIFRFLDGDYALRSILKILVVLFIAIGIFGYYFYDLKRHNYSKKSWVSLSYFIGVVVISLSLLFGSFFIMDSPWEARLKRFDQAKVNDLAMLNSMIISHYQEKGELPADLSDQKFKDFADPQTRAPYHYDLLSSEDYEICAEFNLPAKEKGQKEYPLGGNSWYNHGKGRECYKMKIDNQIKQGPRPYLGN